MKIDPVACYEPPSKNKGKKQLNDIWHFRVSKVLCK